MIYMLLDLKQYTQIISLDVHYHAQKDYEIWDWNTTVQYLSSLNLFIFKYSWSYYFWQLQIYNLDCLSIYLFRMAQY